MHKTFATVLILPFVFLTQTAWCQHKNSWEITYQGANKGVEALVTAIVGLKSGEKTYTDLLRKAGIGSTGRGAQDINSKHPIYKRWDNKQAQEDLSLIELVILRQAIESAQSTNTSDAARKDGVLVDVVMALANRGADISPLIKRAGGYCVANSIAETAQKQRNASMKICSEFQEDNEKKKKKIEDLKKEIESLDEKRQARIKHLEEKIENLKAEKKGRLKRQLEDELKAKRPAKRRKTKH